MKINLRIFSALSKLYRSRHEPENARSIAELYWYGLLFLAIAGIVFSLAFGTWQFKAVVSTLSGSSVPVPRSEAALNRRALVEVVQAMDARQAAFDALRAAPLSVPSPL